MEKKHYIILGSTMAALAGYYVIRSTNLLGSNTKSVPQTSSSGGANSTHSNHIKSPPLSKLAETSKKSKSKEDRGSKAKDMKVKDLAKAKETKSHISKEDI
jgi:hypothetical protein